MSAHPRNYTGPKKQTAVSQATRGGGGGVSAAAGNRWLRTVSREGGVGDGVGVDTGEGGRGGAAPAQALREGHVACPLEARRQQCTARTWVPADVQARWSVD